MRGWGRAAVLLPGRSILAGSERGSTGWVSSDLFTRRNVVSGVQRTTARNTYESVCQCRGNESERNDSSSKHFWRE